MGFNVGGPTAWKVYSRGPIAVAFHWVQGEPSMVLFPTQGRMVLRNCVPYVLPLQRAHQLVKPDSNGEEVDSDVLWQIATKATEVMGFGTDAQVAMKVADVILRSLDDLCRMPPEPQALIDAARPAPTGEMVVKVAGETIFHGEA